MLRFKKITLAILLTGCTTQASDTFETQPLETPINETAIKPNEELLKNIDATLEIADGAIGIINEEKIESQTKILNLQNLVSYEESLIKTLQDSLLIKNNLIVHYIEDNKNLINQLDSTKNEFNYALYKCINECDFKLNELTSINKQLTEDIDSLQNWIFYLDSLVMTNKKLSKNLNLNEIRR